MNGQNDIAQWRLRTFASLMSTVRLVALVAALPSAAFGIANRVFGLAYLAAGALSWILIISWMRQSSYHVRVMNFLCMLFVVAVGVMVMLGSLGLSYLIAIPVMSVILLGLQPALIALIISSVCMFSLGVSGICTLPIANFFPTSLSVVGLFTLTYTCVGTFISISCNTLIKGLSSSLESVRTVAVSLHSLNDELSLTSAALAGLNEMVLIAKVAEGHGTTQPIIFANAMFERCSEYGADEVIGKSMRMLYGPETDPEVVSKIADAIARQIPVSGELVFYKKSGIPCWIEINIVPFAREGREITHWVTVGRDITERRRSAEAIHQLAFFDVLTGLPNRRLLMERLNAMVAGVRSGRQRGALLYIDLDNFKHINDARGHATGDALLKHIATCLLQVADKTDTVARLGGDEFVILLESLDSDLTDAVQTALATADRVRRALTLPIDIDGQLYYSSGSIGVALSTRLEHTAHDLLREADTAMYYAKGAGRNGVALFESAMLAEAENMLMFERDLAIAIEQKELALHFQLQVDHAGIPIGAEVLLRWQRADGVLVPPDIFIPVAEATGLIVQLGAWVLYQSCMAWQELARAGHALPLSVNVSPRQFRQPNFVSEVLKVVRSTGVPPQQLIFEVTEGLLVENVDETVERMQQLAQIGIRFSIDDFGTGYSNLGYLRQMPLYELKIDKIFIRDMPQDLNSTAIVRSILAMARHLNLRVVAEGIETKEQAFFLKNNGRPYMQGYLFCRPMPLLDLLKRLSYEVQSEVHNN